MLLFFSVCLDFIGKAESAQACVNIGLRANETNGVCYNTTTNAIQMIFDLALAKDYNIERKLPSEEYFELV